MEMESLPFILLRTHPQEVMVEAEIQVLSQLLGNRARAEDDSPVFEIHFYGIAYTFIIIPVMSVKGTVFDPYEHFDLPRRDPRERMKSVCLDPALYKAKGGLLIMRANA